MLQTLILNLFIVVLTLMALVHTNNPLCLFALFFLQEFPVHVVTNQQQIDAAILKSEMNDEMSNDDDEDHEPAIGFTAVIK